MKINSNKRAKCPGCGDILLNDDSCSCGWGADISQKKKIRLCRLCENEMFIYIKGFPLCIKHYDEKIGWAQHRKKFPEFFDNLPQNVKHKLLPG